jgi:RHS repeat-associated protein
MYNPVMGRWMSRDPVGATGDSSGSQTLTPDLGFVNMPTQYGDGPNLYEYVQSGPVTKRDPSGLLVWMWYNRATGDLWVGDLDTGETINLWPGCTFSGGPDLIGRIWKPIPTGQYEVLERAGKPLWLRLDPIDAVPRNDKGDNPGEGFGRSEFRMHPGNISEGCITISEKNKVCLFVYQKIRDLLGKTKKVIVPDAAYGGMLYKYGDLAVVDQP